jgi:hypothetical protein
LIESFKVLMLTLIEFAATAVDLGMDSRGGVEVTIGTMQERVTPVAISKGS